MNENEETTPTLDQALDRLRGLQEWDIVIEYLEFEREQCFNDFGKISNGEESMKLAGNIAKLSEIITLFR